MTRTRGQVVHHGAVTEQDDGPAREIYREAGWEIAWPLR